MLTAEESLKKLKEGNARYVVSDTTCGNVSHALRTKFAEEGQHPYAIIIACSDSRVIPNAVFSCGLGDIFTIRVAGNVLDNHQIGSIEYAGAHLDSQLVVVLGHTGCGAVGAAIEKNSDGYIKFITDEIHKAIGDETDDYKATWMNVQYNVDHLRNVFRDHKELWGLKVVGAVYDIKTGEVEFRED